MKLDRTNLSRRLFLLRSAQTGVALTLGLALPHAGGATDGYTGATQAAGAAFEPNAFVAITADNRVVVTVKHLEMGQGTFTGLATIVAEELDAAWDQVDAIGAPANTGQYKNLLIGAQITGGSTSIANSWLQMREAGAAVRHMLLAAAASRWQVPATELNAREGEVLHAASGRQASFGELASAAAKQPVPETVVLKDPKNFTLIGKQRLERKDEGKTDGSAVFTQDVQLPGMLTAVVVHAPVFGARVKQVADKKALAMPGVQAVVRIPTGVAVLATTFYQAQQASKALEIQWSGGDTELSSPQLLRDYRALAEQPGVVAAERGDAVAALAAAEQVIEADYEFPFLAHAAMEPMNCVLQKYATGVEMWYGCQGHSFDQKNVAAVFGLQPEQVKINTLYAGGSFGRRASFDSHYPVELAEIAKAYAKPVPIKLVWTREDDTRGGYYRPMCVHKLQASVDKSGAIAAWQQCIVGQSIMGVAQDKVDRTTVEGAANLPYSVANFRVETHNTTLPIPPLWWRSVGSTHTAYAAETFIDELAYRAQRDPIEFRLGLLADYPRHRQVLATVAAQSGWQQPLPKGHFRGVAVHESFRSYVAQVAEIARQDNGKFRIVKITCAVDCGIAVNPDVIAAQMEGGIGFGLAPLLFSEITIDKGQVVQSNFHDYQVVRMRHMPQVEVHIVPSAEPPTGVGEPGVPVIAPAVANALFSATGKRLRKLPLGEEYFDL